MKTSLVQLRIGDDIIYEPNQRNIRMTIKDYQLCPNGGNDLKIVCVITAINNDGLKVIATSDKFIAIDNEDYETVYTNCITK